jgi:hypothetical protein
MGPKRFDRRSISIRAVILNTAVEPPRTPERKKKRLNRQERQGRQQPGARFARFRIAGFSARRTRGYRISLGVLGVLGGSMSFLSVHLASLAV